MSLTATTRKRRKDLVAVNIGNALEWFDWNIYAVFAPFFAAHFFRNEDPISALLSTLAVFAAGFLMRPVGGWLFGRIADEKGRRFSLTLAITLAALGSLVIAVAPTFGTVGVFASVILLAARLLQGLSHGGETGSAFTYLAEVAPAERRGLWAAADGRKLSGAISVGCFPSLAPTVLPTMFTLFEGLHPDVTVDPVSADQETLLQQLRSGAIELAVMYNMHLDQAFETARLYDTAMHVILPAEHPLAAGSTVPTAALEPEPMILLEVPPSAEDVLSYFRAHGLSPNVRLRTPHFELVRSLVAQGLGYSLFIQRPRIYQSYEGLPIAARALEPRPHLERVSVVWPAGRRLSSKARRFVELAREHVDSYAPAPLYPPTP